ncbi:MAG TPA: YceI family protein [Cryomorphaceae bacterium]|nr:YceI family protein [Cryomorphaceae bacterium]
MAPNTLSIDTKNSKASFDVKKLGLFTIKGSITDFTGEVHFDKDALDKSNFKVCVSPSTIDTGISKRDEHLKSQDFFHVNKHPKICFQSTSIQSNHKGYRAIGILSILGTTKEVNILFSLGSDALHGKLTLNRSNFNLGKKFPAFIVGKTIHISIKCTIAN